MRALGSKPRLSAQEIGIFPSIQGKSILSSTDSSTILACIALKNRQHAPQSRREDENFLGGLPFVWLVHCRADLYACVMMMASQDKLFAAVDRRSMQ